jgi:hypothetical protein
MKIKILKYGIRLLTLPGNVWSKGV